MKLPLWQYIPAWLRITHPVVCGFLIGNFLYFHQWLLAAVLFVSIIGVIIDGALEWAMYDHS